MSLCCTKLNTTFKSLTRPKPSNQQPLLNLSEDKDHDAILIDIDKSKQTKRNKNSCGMGEATTSHPKYGPTISAAFVHSLNTTIFLSIPSGVAVKDVEPLFYAFGGIATLNFVSHTIPGLYKDYTYPLHKNDIVPFKHKKIFQLTRAAMETVNVGLIISAVFLAKMWAPNGPKNYELFTGVLSLSGIRELGALAKAYRNQDPWLFTSNALHVGFIVSATIAINFKNEGGVLSGHAHDFELHSSYFAGAFSAAMILVTLAHYFIAGYKEPREPLFTLEGDAESELEYVTLGI